MTKSVVLFLLLTFGISTSAEATSTDYKSLEELKTHLQQKASNANKGQSTCDAHPHRGNKWSNKSSNSIISSVLNIEKSDMEAVSSKYINSHLKVKETTHHMNNPTCVNVYAETAGQKIRLVKERKNITSSSATSEISRSISIGAEASASLGIYSAKVDVDYNSTSNNSTSVSSSLSNSDQTEYTLPLNYNEKDGPYSAWFHTNRYTNDDRKTLDVTYTVKSLTITASCEWESTKGSKDHFTPTDEISIGDLASETEYKIPTLIRFDVDYVDQWPSYRLVFGKQCDGSPFVKP